MKNSILLKSSKILLILNIFFWLGVAIYFSFFKFASYENYLILKVLLFFEPLLYLVALLGIIKKNKIVYLLSLLFVFANTILSITDEVGVYDIISLVLSSLTFINLILIWKQILKK